MAMLSTSVERRVNWQLCGAQSNPILYYIEDLITILETCKKACMMIYDVIDRILHRVLMFEDRKNIQRQTCSEYLGFQILFGCYRQWSLESASLPTK
jgi:hypothetical protein